MRNGVILLLVVLGGCSGSYRFVNLDHDKEEYVKMARSSTVEPSAHNALVAGSSPAAPIRVAIPKAAYDHPYSGRVKEHYVPLATARSMCARHDACNWVARDGTCHIVIPFEHQSPARDRRAYERWEIAGCNGHPDQIIALKQR